MLRKIKKKVKKRFIFADSAQFNEIKTMPEKCKKKELKTVSISQILHRLMKFFEKPCPKNV